MKFKGNLFLFVGLVLPGILNISVQNKETYSAEAKMIIDPIDEGSGSTYNDRERKISFITRFS